VGHLFQGRYKAILVDKDSYLLELSRYVVLNPVRVGMVEHPGDWPWSSFRAMVGDAPVPGWLATDWLLDQFVKRRTEARRRYRKFVAEGGASVWSGLRQQIYLGDDSFVAKMQKKVPVQTDQLNIPRAQRRGPAPPLEAIAAEHPERTPPLLRLMRLAPTATARLPIISVCTRRRWDGWCAAECYHARPDPLHDRAHTPNLTIAQSNHVHSQF
jgi:hypothetical protein